MNKAEKSQIIVLIACFACVFLSAALIWNYYKKPADENEALIVTIKYPEYENAVITPVSTMECAIDNEFLHELQQISSSSDGNTDEHSYNYQYDTVPDRIYIKAPDIYVFEQGKSKSSMTPCSVGSIAYYDDAPWFSITAVTIDKLYTGVFDITIFIKAFKDIVPVMTTLKIGDVVLDEGKGQILRPTPNTAPLICGAYYNTQLEDLLTMALDALILFHRHFHRYGCQAVRSIDALRSSKHSDHLPGLFR